MSTTITNYQDLTYAEIFDIAVKGEMEAPESALSALAIDHLYPSCYSNDQDPDRNNPTVDSLVEQSKTAEMTDLDVNALRSIIGFIATHQALSKGNEDMEQGFYWIISKEITSYLTNNEGVENRLLKDQGASANVTRAALVASNEVAKSLAKNPRNPTSRLC
jgi:hypothetical protein